VKITFAKGPAVLGMPLAVFHNPISHFDNDKLLQISLFVWFFMAIDEHILITSPPPAAVR